MKQVSNAVLIFLLATVTASAGPKTPGGYGQDFLQRTARDDYRDLWRGMKTGLSSIQKGSGEKDPGITPLVTQIRTNAQFLEDKWDAWFRSQDQQRYYPGADDYLITLRGSNHQINKLRTEKDTVKILDALRDIAFDMQIKADNCRNSGDGLGKEIRVKVHTKANGREIGGYEVFYVSKGMYEVKSAHDRFPRQSSPTDEKILCPGGYALWVKKQNFTSEPITLGIGGHGETKLDVDVPVPAE